MNPDDQTLEIDDSFQEEDEDTQKDKYLTFHLAGEDYGIDIVHVTEIIGIQKITEVPDMPVFLKGVINLRGKVIPVVDVRLRFGLHPIPYGDRTCIIVVDVNNAAVGLVVDEVSEVASIPADMIEPPPRSSQESTGAFLKGMGKTDDKVKILLDVRRLLFGLEQHLGEAA